MAQTHTQMDIPNYILDWSKGQFRENYQMPRVAYAIIQKKKHCQS